MSLYLSRLRLSRAPSVAALKALIDPDALDADARQDAHHRLIWSAFAGDPAVTRDFLWREEGEGVFLVQSPRRPSDSPFFEPPEVRELVPDLRPGDRLSFLLRANATRDLRGENRQRQRVDVVMDLLHKLPKAERAERRAELAEEAARRWLSAQGARAGFRLERLTLRDYSTVTLPGHRGRRQGVPRFGILDMTGEITVTEVVPFLVKLTQGFGRAKGFGCGLMLIRRA